MRIGRGQRRDGARARVRHEAPAVRRGPVLGAVGAGFEKAAQGGGDLADALGGAADLNQGEALARRREQGFPFEKQDAREGERRGEAGARVRVWFPGGGRTGSVSGLDGWARARARGGAGGTYRAGRG